MNEKKSLTTEETFALAYQNHKKNNLQVAENLYKETLKNSQNSFKNSILKVFSFNFITRMIDTIKNRNIFQIEWINIF